VEGALGFDDAVPVERRAGFGEGGDFARQFAAVSAGFESGDGVAVENDAQDEIKDQSREGKRGAGPATRAFATGADFFGNESADRGEKNSSKEDSQSPEIERGEPIESEAASRERPEELGAGGLAKVEGEMKEGGGEGCGEDGSARDGVFGGFGLEEEEGKSSEEGEDESDEERMKVGTVEIEISGRAAVGAEEVGVGDRAGKHDGESGGAGDAREGGALERERG